MHAPDNTENLRNATAIVIVAVRTIPPNAARETATTTLQCNSNNNNSNSSNNNRMPALQKKETVDASVAENFCDLRSWNTDIVVRLVSGSHLCGVQEILDSSGNECRSVHRPMRQLLNLPRNVLSCWEILTFCERVKENSFHRVKTS